MNTKRSFSGVGIVATLLLLPLLLSVALVLYIKPIPVKSFTIEQDFKLMSGETRDGRLTHCYEPDELQKVTNYQSKNGQLCSTGITIIEIAEEMQARARILNRLPVLSIGFDMFTVTAPSNIQDYEYCVEFDANPIIPDDKSFITVVLPNKMKISPGDSPVCEKLGEDFSGEITFDPYYCTKEYSPFILHFKKTIRTKIDVIIKPEFWFIQTLVIFVFSYFTFFVLLGVPFVFQAIYRKYCK